ncbi:MAG: hypothetical protein RMJ98_17530 [Myxococcales bacterium]|nr:hypothetical protein [Polyangiaceae bacterium]MDW8251097.1 hypothetical protein [Myxococcales bacterium]
MAADDCLQFGIDDQRNRERGGHGGQCHIVMGGTDAAAGKEQVVACAQVTDFLDEDGEVIEYHPHVAKLDSKAAKEPCQGLEVGITDFTAKELVADKKSGSGAGH